MESFVLRYTHIEYIQVLITAGASIALYNEGAVIMNYVERLLRS